LRARRFNSLTDAARLRRHSDGVVIATACAGDACLRARRTAADDETCAYQVCTQLGVVRQLAVPHLISAGCRFV